MFCYKHEITYYLNDCPECLKEKYQKKPKTDEAKSEVSVEAIVIPHWEFRMHINGFKQHSLLHRDDKLKIQREIYTPVDKDGFTNSKKQKVYYFIDGDDREFKTEQELIKALVASAV